MRYKRNIIRTVAIGSLAFVTLAGASIIADAVPRASGHTIPKSACTHEWRGHETYPQARRAYMRCRARARVHNRSHMCGNRAPAAQAIRCIWGARAAEALRVASCESGLSTRALGPRDEYGNRRPGLFQLGTYERSKSGHYTHRSPAIVQARSAYRWFVLTGRDWGAWECQP